MTIINECFYASAAETDRGVLRSIQSSSNSNRFDESFFGKIWRIAQRCWLMHILLVFKHAHCCMHWHSLFLRASYYLLYLFISFVHISLSLWDIFFESFFSLFFSVFLSVYLTLPSSLLVFLKVILSFPLSLSLSTSLYLDLYLSFFLSLSLFLPCSSWPSDLCFLLTSLSLTRTFFCSSLHLFLFIIDYLLFKSIFCVCVLSFFLSSTFSLNFIWPILFLELLFLFFKFLFVLLFIPMQWCSQSSAFFFPLLDVSTTFINLSLSTSAFPFFLSFDPMLSLSHLLHRSNRSLTLSIPVSCSPHHLHRHTNPHAHVHTLAYSLLHTQTHTRTLAHTHSRTHALSLSRSWKLNFYDVWNRGIRLQIGRTRNDLGTIMEQVFKSSLS